MRRDPSVFAISLTPFDHDQNVDEDALRAHLRRLADAGVGVYVGGAGSGEGYSLTRDEVDRILAVAVDEVGGRVPVRAMGVEPRTAAEMIDFAERVEASGVDAMQLYSLDLGHLGNPDPAEIEGYLRAVLDATRVPVVISSHFSVGYFIPVELLGRLVVDYDHIIGINCTNTDLRYLTNVIAAVPDRVDVHTGFTAQALPALSLGASGYLTTEANTVPRMCVAVIDAWKAGDLDATAAAFDRLWRYSTELLANGGSIRATKSVLAQLGLPGGIPRLPRRPLEDTREIERLAGVIERFDIARFEGIA